MASPESGQERWRLLEKLFNQALDLPAEQRLKFVDDACGGDSGLRRELESLLKSAEEPADFLQQVIHGAAHDVVTDRGPAMLAAGSPFAHYEIIGQLGAGGMGQVYLGSDSRLRRKVALKVLPAGFRDEGSLRRFKQEAQAASALNHPNIHTIYEVGDFEGTDFIASEFVEGLTVREKLANGPLAVKEAVDLASQIAAGLAAAHAAGITHRDIKPENVIVRPDGLVKVVDFGIAKLSAESTARSGTFRASALKAGQTLPGLVLGTAKYMSPEQARGLPVDGRTDIFSLGAVLYEMLTGRAPFEGATESDLMAEILKTDPPPLEQAAPQVPKALAAIVAKAMRKDMAARYQSAGEMQTDLQALQRDLDFRSRGTALSAWRVGLAAVVAVAAGIGLLYWWQSRIAPVQAAPKRLAILPFRNVRADPATDFLGFSLADAVITKLGYVNTLTIRPSSSIERYRNQSVDPAKVGADLKVDTLLTGSYFKEGDDLHINTQLVDVRRVQVLWQDTLDVKYENLLHVQDRVAEQIIGRLQLSLSSTEAGNLKLDNPTSRAAYEFYLRGVDLYALNDFSGAITALEKSAAMEPNYAPTWANLGRAYTTNASLQFGGRAQYAKAEAAYEKAMVLNPALPEPRTFMANLFTDTGRVEQAFPLLLDAAKNNWNNAEVHWELGYVYRFTGLLAESVRECERAREIDPQVKITSSALNSYLYVGAYDKFLASLPQSDTAYILFYRGFGEYYKHEYERALVRFDRAYELDPELLQAQVGKALAFAIRHKNQDGLRLLDETERKIRQSGVADAEGVYKVSQAYAELDDNRSALRMLGEAIDGGFFPYPYFVSDPLLARLRREPAFAALMAKARTRHEAFKAKFAELSK